MRHIETPKWGKPGNVALVAPAAMLMLMGVGAFVFDLGYVSLERTRLQTAADAAATAAARKLDGTPTGVTNARNEAAAVVALNDTQNEMGFDKSRDLTFGYWDEDARTFDSSAPVTVQNAVRINMERSRAHNNALAPFFARIVGVNSLEAYAKSSVYVTSSFSDPEDNEGVPGGHFDVDSDHLSTLLPRPLKTSTYCSSSSACPQLSDGHVHQYDNEFDTRVLDLRNPLEASGSSNPGVLRSIQADVGTNKFKIIIANADLSPGVDIIVNGVRRSVKAYGQIPFADLPTFGPSNPLTELKLEMLENSLDTASVHRTNYDCAWNNLRGHNGEWRNGALTVQAIQVASTVAGSINGTISSTVTKAGGQGVAVNGLLHEVFMFWHASWKSGSSRVNAHCYSDKDDWDSDWIHLGHKQAHLVKF